jgi:hypothetical protein
MSDGFNVSKYLNFSNTFPEKENISTSAILIEKKKFNLNFNTTFPKEIPGIKNPQFQRVPCVVRSYCCGG